MNSIVKWSISGESITKDLVLKELGILDRFEDKLSHYFKVSVLQSILDKAKNDEEKEKLKLKYEHLIRK